MQLLIAAGVPSAIVAFCFWLLERRIQERAEAEKDERARRQKEQDDKEKNREELQYMMLKALDGSLCLSEATAKVRSRWFLRWRYRKSSACIPGILCVRS